MRTPARRLTLLDILTLVAATALGLPWVRSSLEYWWSAAFPHMLPAWPLTKWQWVVSMRSLAVVLAVSPCALTLSIAALALQFRPPRERLRRLTTRPGLVACAMATSIGPVAGGYWLAILAIEANLWSPSADPASATLELLIPAMIGCGTAGAWLLLVLSRRWRPQASWADRLGRLLGSYWLATMLLCRIAPRDLGVDRG